MPDIQLPLKAFSAVGPGNIAISDLQLDRDYHSITLEASATSKTNIDAIVDRVAVVVNGVTVRDLTPAQIRRCNGINGSIYNAAAPLQLTLNFREDWLWNTTGADMLSLHAAGVRNARIEVALKSGITNPTLGGYYSGQDRDARIAKETNIVRWVKPIDLTFGAAGETSFRNLPFAGLLRRIHLQSSTVTEAKFKQGETEKFNLTKARLTDLLTRNALVDSADWFVVGWDFTQRPADGIPANEIIESELAVTVNAGGTIRALAEYFAPIPQ